MRHHLDRRFLDEHGREWQVRVDVATLKRWRDRLGIDFARVCEEGFAPILTDPVRFGEVLYQTCHTRAEKESLSEEEFFGLLHGSTLEAAQSAWLEAVVDFFPNRDVREKLGAAIAEAKGSPRPSGKESAGAPANWESTPTATPYAN